MATIELALDDYTDLPPGRIAAVVTHLEMTAPPAPATAETPPAAPEDIALERMSGADVPRYRALFAAVGEPWLWFGRCRLSDDALAAILADAAVEAFAVTRDGADIGLLELDARADREVELAYFGVIPDAVGTGLGRFMMETALWKAWARRPTRVTVHTCTLDHPAALDFYRRAGFVPVRRAIEVAEDPRLNGLLPRDAAPQVPLLG